MKATNIINNPTHIKEIEWVTVEDCPRFKVGSIDVTEIIPYSEHGIGSDTTWLAVFAGEKIIARVPAWQVSIYY